MNRPSPYPGRPTYPFELGFYEAIRLWRDGYTWELILNQPECDASPRGRGMWSGVQAMSGCVQSAEREARAHGFSRETAEELCALGVAA